MGKGDGSSTGTDGMVFDKNYAQVMDWLLKNDLRTKTAAEVERRAVEYFRGPNFVEVVGNNKKTLIEKFPKVFERNKLETKADIELLGATLMNKKFIVKATYKPLEGTKEAVVHSKTVTRPKWPNRLSAIVSNDFDPNQFYILRYEHNKRLQYIYLALIVGLVIAVCLFPVWPLQLKFALWYVFVFLTTILLQIVVIRLIIFASLWFLGFDCWLFPKLFDEEASVVESFIPWYSFEKRLDGFVMMMSRAVFFLLLVLSMYQLSQTHSLSDVGYFAKDSLIDIVDWGIQKLAPPDSTDIYTFGTKNVFEEKKNTNIFEKPSIEDFKSQLMTEDAVDDEELNSILTDAE